ncbi:MAG: hypothetical protein DME19_13080 [Verrucomicrobia bacterium]|nr:MAG: hypothetical protein DME19_13080 [Verrucomicrobiota bacterium]
MRDCEVPRPGVEILLATESQLRYFYRVVSKKPSFAKPAKGSEQTFVCPLSKLRAGAACRIKQLSASPEIVHRLREMGFCEEQRVKLLSQHNNVICQVCNVRVGISAELADSIWVEPLRAEEKVA